MSLGCGDPLNHTDASCDTCVETGGCTFVCMCGTIVRQFACDAGACRLTRVVSPGDLYALSLDDPWTIATLGTFGVVFVALAVKCACARRPRRAVTKPSATPPAA